jgi:dTDP-4-amino-4,6-dideoxygalactose transaminase
MYKNTGKLPITEKISKKIVSLPIHPNLTENDIDKIIVNVNRFAN